MRRFKLIFTLEAVRPWLLLAPALAVILLLFVGGLAATLLQSLGYLPLIGERALSLRAYADILSSRSFGASLALTLYIALVSTAISALLALAVSLALRATRAGRRALTFIFQLNLPIPHIVGAVAIAQLLAQSGLLARLAAALGLIDDPAQFPPLVSDRWAIGIIVANVWKEAPFIGVTLLAVLENVGEEYEQVAQTLGAGRWQRFRNVLLPLLLPALLSSSVIVFAFVFGAFELPFFLGVSFPQTLPVLAYRSYADVDLNARPQAMAMSVVIALICAALVWVYLWASRRWLRNDER
ncbi:MAG: sugar ABC transporter permease [Chloroflexales bacterium]|nr:sugar ABC transporter permease [Chloroflexales bacterium]